jgi:hypothetical protein
MYTLNIGRTNRRRRSGAKSWERRDQKWPQSTSAILCPIGRWIVMCCIFVFLLSLIEWIKMFGFLILPKSFIVNLGKPFCWWLNWIDSSAIGYWLFLFFSFMRVYIVNGIGAFIKLCSYQTMLYISQWKIHWCQGHWLSFVNQSFSGTYPKMFVGHNTFFQSNKR